MIDDSGAMLNEFLIYVDLADCRPQLGQIGVCRFDHLCTLPKKALEPVLPNPAVDRILANVDKFAAHCPKREKYPPLKDFLEKLQLTDIQEELEDRLKISRVEHLQYATEED
ncbi:unnamed protein product [Hymenolepis diminuta]|uniref:non-specific protein-tyrosine kinase n=1 Tax=Hymenolepis diminuta TaxID=6216 RepID=A0A564Z777_HYMDI|nr:unnamed protein product [Hymenolepis diminuta]